MCLIYAKIKETTEDIVCYKVYISFEGKLRSPFMRSLAPNMNEVAKTYFGNYEGKQLILPSLYLPSKKLLEKHQKKVY